MTKKDGMRSLLFIITLSCLTFAENPKAPDFALRDLDGDTVSLSRFRGKVVVLDFWVMWCETCREEVPKIQKLFDRYGDRGVVFLGIHCGEKDAAKIKAFVENAGIRYRILTDPEDTLADRFKLKGIPSMVIVDTAGIIIKTCREIDKKTGKEINRILDSLIKK